MILDYALYLKSKLELRDRIKAIIKLVAKSLPTDLIDRDKYIMGLYRASERMITLYYDTQVSRFYNTIALLTLLGFAEAQKIKNGIELSKVVEENKSYIVKEFHNRDLKYVAKGYPNVIDYDRELKKTIQEMSSFEVVSDEAGKKPISLFQKAEIDLRHEKQMDMIQDLKDSGIQYAWTSSHVDCSKRCEPWQGKLFDIQAESSELSGHRMSKKLDGHTVYCLKEVISKVDKYGYTNNILVGFNCFDNETEVLTNNGWKRFYDLTADDLIYTLNIDTRETEWQKPINYYKKFHNGKMIHFRSFTSDLLVTPNHNMVMYNQNNKHLRFKEAEILNQTDYQYAGQEWTGNKQKHILVGKTAVDSKLFCRLLAYYLADGSIHNKTSIQIAQQNNDKMWENLQGLPFRLWRDKNKIIVYGKELHDLFASLGHCNTKYVFKWVKELSKECLTEFLNSYIFTDGYKAKQTFINGHPRKPHQIVFTVSPQLMADLCEIALKCGYRPKVSINKNKGKITNFKNGSYVLNYDVYIIHLNYYTSFTYKTNEREEYNDFVYCVEVPNHTLLVKRNGFVQWCGNCRHKLIAYTGEIKADTYTKEEIEKEREINANMRSMERHIRQMKQELELAKINKDTELVKKLKRRIEVATQKYFDYCEKNGFATLVYRLG